MQGGEGGKGVSCYATDLDCNFWGQFQKECLCLRLFSSSHRHEPTILNDVATRCLHWFMGGVGGGGFIMVGRA